MMRLHHVLSHASLLRWDDKQSIAWADVFVQKAPVDEGPQDCVVLTISLDDDKCNADGAWHQAGTMRNVRSPAECPHFGTAYEMFHQFELLRIGPKYDDFRPRPEVDPDDGETKVVRPWFDGLVFNGTNAEKQRDGTAPGDYSTVRRACKRMHESTTPPMNQNGVALHMERGVSARDKEYHGLRPDQSKKAGRWKTGRGAHEISTPTACLATSCASPAASPRCTPATSTRCGPSFPSRRRSRRRSSRRCGRSGPTSCRASSLRKTSTRRSRASWRWSTTFPRSSSRTWWSCARRCCRTPSTRSRLSARPSSPSTPRSCSRRWRRRRRRT